MTSLDIGHYIGHMRCKTVNCNGYVYLEAIGYCPFCIEESRNSKITTEKKIIVADESDMPVQHYSKPPDIKGGKILTAENVQDKSMSNTSNVQGKEMSKDVQDLKLCSICKKKPRAEWSDSYCRGCYAAWKKERRKQSK